MTPVKVGDRVKVVRGFSVGSKGTVVRVTDIRGPYHCLVQRDEAGPTDKMAYRFDELASMMPLDDQRQRDIDTLNTLAELSGSMRRYTEHDFKTFSETPEEKEERLLTMAGVKQPGPSRIAPLTPEQSDEIDSILADLKPDPVNSPSHYNTGGIECFDAMSAMLTREEMIGYLRGNSFKYRWRFRHKGGAEDLRKAEWYEKKLLDLIENSA